MKQLGYIFILASAILLQACSGSKKYFKAAEKLEKQGLVNEAADYYLESLQRKPTNVDARIKLKQVGQKYVSSLASQFFREYNTQQLEASLVTYEKLKAFTDRTSALNVQLDYPNAYDEDYKNAVESYCSKNYAQALVHMNQKKYADALVYIRKVKKYNADYRNLRQLDIVAVCEPLYQAAINNLENKNYTEAHRLLAEIRYKTEDYKDSGELLELATAQQERSFLLFEPKNPPDAAEREIEEHLFNDFSRVAQERFGSVKIINNSPFRNAPEALLSGTNVDLIQAVRKATGADYFYVYDVVNRREQNSGPVKTRARGFQEVKVKKNDTTVVTEYHPFDYNVVKATRTFSYEFKFKLINAYSNQIVSGNTHVIRSQDVVEYQEFHRPFQGNINTLYPYNPATTGAAARFNARNWRALFSARNTLKTFEELKSEALKDNSNVFATMAGSMR